MQMTSRPALRLFLALTTCSVAAAAQEAMLVAKHELGHYLSQYARVAALGDIDKDGFPEIAVGNSGVQFAASAGEVLIYSTRDMRPLWRIFGTATAFNSRFAREIAAIADLDADGTNDLLVTEFSDVTGGTVHAFSSRSGKSLFKTIVSLPHGGDPEALTSIGDADRDGYEDFVVTTRDSLVACSGKDGSVLYPVTLGTGERGIGRELHRVPDVNGDKIDDFAALCEYLITVTQGRGPGVRIYSGKDGARLFDVLGITPSQSSSSGKVLAIVGDRDGDLYPEIAAIKQNLNPNTLTAQILSMRTGVQLWESQAQPSGPGAQAQAVAQMGDLDNDGVADFGVRYRFTPDSYRDAWYLVSTKTSAHLGTLHYSDGKTTVGYSATPTGDLDGDGKTEVFMPLIAQDDAVGLLSTIARDLRGERLNVSILTKEPQVLTIDAGPQFANRIAFLIGSASGTKPGLSIGGQQLLLNLDSYTTLTLSAPHAFFYNNLAVLDANGQGKAAWVLPKGIGPALSGLRLDHAALLLGPGGIEKVTLPMGLVLQAF